jgi:hypothetical protein
MEACRRRVALMEACIGLGAGLRRSGRWSSLRFSGERIPVMWKALTLALVLGAAPLAVQASPGQNLDAAGKIGRVIDRAADCGHGCDNLGPDLAVEVRNVVHVLHEDGVTSPLGQRPHFLHGGAD